MVEATSNILYTGNMASPGVDMIKVIAAAADVPLKVVFLTAAEKDSAEQKALGFPGKYPKFVCADGVLIETIAIAKYLAHGTSVMPTDAWQKAKTDQWLLWQVETVFPKIYPAMKAIFGFSTEVTAAEYKDADMFMKSCVKTLNVELVANEWIAGTPEASFVDYAMACWWSLMFQTVLDKGFLKAKPHQAVATWFNKVCALPAFVKAMGHVKCAEK